MSIYTSKIPSILGRIRELEDLPHAIVAFGRDYPAGHLIERHSHLRAQLIYASSGIMRVDTPRGIWVVPPLVPHEIRANSTVRLRTLLLSDDAQTGLPRECCVIEVSSLLPPSQYCQQQSV